MLVYVDVFFFIQGINIILIFQKKEKAIVVLTEMKTQDPI